MNFCKIDKCDLDINFVEILVLNINDEVVLEKVFFGIVCDLLVI